MVGGGGGQSLPVRFVIAGLRVVSWPLVGLITDAFPAAVLTTSAVVLIVIWRWRSAGPGERVAVRWLGLGLLWSVLFLTIAAPSLASVVAGLPNDHYHAFADPMVFVLVGLGVAAAVRPVLPGSAHIATAGSETAGSATVIAAGALVAFVALLGWNVTHQPPSTHPDGGFPPVRSPPTRSMPR